MNVGGLSFTYGLETDDTIGSSYVFNAHDAAWITFARGIFDAAQTMYRNRESAGCFNTANFLAKVRTWQATRPERVWVADAQRKYLRPYEDNGTETYLPMLAGKKTHQREQVKTYNSYYFGSKYVSDFCTSQNIMVRGNTPTSGTSITVVPPANTAVLSMYINCYIVVASTSYNVVAKTKATRGQTYTMDFSTIGSMGETELYFCTAPMITELSGLAHLYFKQNNFAMGTNLQRLEIGSDVVGYENPNLESLTIGNNTMLEYLDVRNCPNATGALDLSGCVSLSEVYLENTGFTGITFATGGLLETAHLPEPTSITMRELIYLDDLTLESADSLATLRIEDCTFDSSAELTIGSTTTAQSTKDIALNLVDSSTNLSRVRLVGIDWTLADATTLNRLIGLTGIDDDSFDISQSVLTGDAYVPTMRSGLLSAYNAAWPYLDITYTTMIAQYLATFVNADGNPILDKNGNAYTQWVDSGSAPYNPITMGYTIDESGAGTPTSLELDPSDYSGDYYLDTLNGFIYTSNGTTWSSVAECDVLIPTLASTAQYTYTFSGWDDITTGMSASRTVTAEYTSTLRTYTVTWYKYAGASLETQTGVNYGAEVTFSGDIPTWTDSEAQYTYHVFKGWDKSTGHIESDTDVYAVWDTITALPALGTDLKDMSIAQIYGVAVSGRASSYFEDKDYVEFYAGHDFNFSNVTSEVLLQNTYFDGTNVVEKDIKLFDANAESFVLAIDFEFTDTTTDNTLVACFEEDGAEGVRLRYSGNPNVHWGSANVQCGYQYQRGMVVIRHAKGSNNLFVYSSDVSTSANAFPDSNSRSELVRNRSTSTDSKLVFGAVKYADGYDYYGKGWIHWCKIWHADLGDAVCRELAYWTHEKWRAEYCGTSRYRLAGNTVSRSNASFIMNNMLNLGHVMNATNTNAGGWPSCAMRTFVNSRVYNAFPVEWQAIMKQCKISSTSGSQSSSIVTSEDYVYIPCLAEMNGSTSTPYINEGESISFFTSNPLKAKFRGQIISENAQIITNQSDPTLLSDYTVVEGDIWVNSGSSNTCYMYFSATTIAKHKYLGILVSSSDNLSAGDGGKWIRAQIWWERSPLLSNSTSFYSVSTTGNAGYSNSGADYVFGVVPCFSI